MDMTDLYYQATPCVVGFISRFKVLPANTPPLFPDIFVTSFLVDDCGTVITNRHVIGDVSPEKAGVGGSIPSLATIFSTSYKPSSQRLRSKTFQLRGGVGLLPPQNFRKMSAGFRHDPPDIHLHSCPLSTLRERPGFPALNEMCLPCPRVISAGAGLSTLLPVTACKGALTTLHSPTTANRSHLSDGRSWLPVWANPESRGCADLRLSITGFPRTPGALVS
jgi:hypothetical protein